MLKTYVNGYAMALRTTKQLVAEAAKWLDHQPLPLVITAGVMLGVGLGLPGFWYLRSPGWLLLWGVLGVGLWRLGRDAEPGFEDEQHVPAKPQRVRDGSLVMMELPGGPFRMGSPDSDDMADGHEKPQHTVTVSGFRIGVTPVTAGLYREVMQQEPPPDDQRQLPIVNVEWDDAIRFCNTLSAREGYLPCYRQADGQWNCDWSADGYRLPTEAEWEYACRAGTETRYSFGDDPEMLDDYAWFERNSGNRVQEVRGKAPNPWGLYDMHGNVWEWCWDAYKPYTTNRRWRWPLQRRSVTFEDRVVRGGSFFHSPERLRSAFRFGRRPVDGGWDQGFRCVRVPPQLLNH